MPNILMETLKDKYINKKILVVGLGLQAGGAGIAKFFCDLGAKVTVTDKKTEPQLATSIDSLKGYPIAFHLGGHQLADFLDSDVIFKGPSVPWTMTEIVEAEKKGIPVEMEMSFVAANYPGKMIGITGTRGKSTTTNMIYDLLELSGFRVQKGGGLPGISTINLIKDADANTWLVAELSSWALSGFHRRKVSPHVAVFTNFYPDHLNYYKNLEDYYYDKQAIFQYQKDGDCLIASETIKNVIASVAEQSQKEIASPSSKIPPRDDRLIYFDKKDFPFTLSYLRGDHNLENAAAAFKVAEFLKINKDKAIQIIRNYHGLPYRLQMIGTKDGLTFVNDTTSTTPIATVKAIEALSDKKIILFLGGNSKNLPQDILYDKLDKVDKIVLLAGSFTEEIMPTLKHKFADKLTGPFDNLETAVKTGYQLGKNLNQESYLLFSPGATSFAMFNNEFHRGEEFNRIAGSIINV